MTVIYVDGDDIDQYDEGEENQPVLPPDGIVRLMWEELYMYYMVEW